MSNQVWIPVHVQKRSLFLSNIALLLLYDVVSVCLACNADNKQVAHCLHTYLERDFNAIEGLVYPRRGASRRSDEGLRKSSWPEGVGEDEGHRFNSLHSRGFLLDGPEIDESCRHLSGVITCFETVLMECASYGEFFRYRHLLYSVSRVQRWLCDDLPHRFVPFLTSLRCYEYVRLSSDGCRESALDSDNLWNQILRLQMVQPKVCTALRRQFLCLESGPLQQFCSSEAISLYSNVTQLFHNSWCNRSACLQSAVSITMLMLTSVAVSLVS